MKIIDYLTRINDRHTRKGFGDKVAYAIYLGLGILVFALFMWWELTDTTMQTP